MDEFLKWKNGWESKWVNACRFEPEAEPAELKGKQMRAAPARFDPDEIIKKQNKNKSRRT